MATRQRALHVGALVVVIAPSWDRAIGTIADPTNRMPLNGSGFDFWVEIVDRNDRINLYPFATSELELAQ